MQLVGSGNELRGIHGFKKLCAHFVAHMLQGLIAAVFLQQLPDDPPGSGPGTLKSVGNFAGSQRR